MKISDVYDSSKQFVPGAVHAISHTSALNLRRRLAASEAQSTSGISSSMVFLQPAPEGLDGSILTVPEAVRPPREFAHLVECGLLSNPVSVIVPKAVNRRKQSSRPREVLFRSRIWSCPTPAGSFDELVFSRDVVGGELTVPSEGPSSDVEGTKVLACSTPQLIFAQMSNLLDELDLITLGCELCGRYSLVPDAEDGFVRHETWCTPEDVLAYLRAIGWTAKGHPRAFQAARRIVGGAFSPLEVAAYELLCLSPRLGGYGIPAPMLNPWVSEDGQVLDEQQHGALRPDLFWPEAGLDIEVHGFQRHMGSQATPSKPMDDVNREAQLEARGIEVIPLTIKQMRDGEIMGQLALRVLKRLGLGRKMPSGDVWQARKEALRDRVIPRHVTR